MSADHDITPSKLKVDVARVHPETDERGRPVQSALRSLVKQLTTPAERPNVTERRIIADERQQNAEIAATVEQVLSAIQPEARAHIAELEAQLQNLKDDQQAAIAELDRLQTSDLNPGESQRQRQKAYHALEDQVDETQAAIQAAHAALTAARGAQADIVRRTSLEALERAEQALTDFDEAHRLERNRLWSVAFTARRAREWLKLRDFF